MDKPEKTLDHITNPLMLIGVAIKDFAKILKDDRYVVDMAEWHDYYSTTEKCHVCMAGAVMAGTLEMDCNMSITPGCTSSNNKLLLINEWRCGYAGSIQLMCAHWLNWEDIIQIALDAVEDELAGGDIESWQTFRNLVELNAKKEGLI